MYLAGRMHKPLEIISMVDDTILSSMNTNLTSALRTSLLLLPKTFSRDDLYITIAGLSYGGDFRMWFGENPDKVKNIVHGSFEQFDSLYQPLLVSQFNCVWSASRSQFEQDKSPDYIKVQQSLLPLSIRYGDCEPSAIQSRLRSIVSRTSMMQSAKGIVTAGPVKSGKYVGAKVLKWANWWGRRLL
jgi:translocator assembly and maintenance protein 41